MASASRRTPARPDMVKCHPPTLQDLDAKAQLSIKDPDAPQVTAEEWYCTNRAAHRGGDNVLNAPTDNFLLWLPPLHCSECGKVVSPPLHNTYYITACLPSSPPISSATDPSAENNSTRRAAGHGCSRPFRPYVLCITSSGARDMFALTAGSVAAHFSLSRAGRTPPPWERSEP